MDVSIIIVSYNTRDLTLDCLRSVYAETSGIEFEVLLVDNASTDDSAAAIAAKFPQVRLFTRSDNIGFAAANNIASNYARGAWLLLLNPDTVVLDGAVDKLVAFAKHRSEADPRFGIFGGRTLFRDGSLNPTCCWMRPTPWSAFCNGSGLTHCFRNSRIFNLEAMPRWRRDTVREVDIVTGCFFLIRRALWTELDGFAPGFFMYCEEADLCLRAQRRGMYCLFFPDATIIHYGGASEKVRSEKMVRLFRAKARFFRRNWSPLAAWIGVAMLDLWAISRLVAYTSAGLNSRSGCGKTRTWREVWRHRREWHDVNQ